MEHETALSDLDATHERAQQLESENGHLKAEFARRQTEFQFFIEQVNILGRTDLYYTSTSFPHVKFVEPTLPLSPR
jgi:hypothetical protein